MKKIWNWLGEDKNHNALMVIITFTALILALPYFSSQINKIEVKVDSLGESIKNIYGQYAMETFCYPELKDSFSKNDRGQNIVNIKLNSEPVLNSVNVWEGAVNIAPSYFIVKDKVVETQTNFDAAGLEQACSDKNADFRYVVTYIPALD